MFQKFRYETYVKNLWDSGSLENHSLLVMNALDDIFLHFDDQTYLCEILTSTAKIHRKIVDFKPTMFYVSILYEPSISGGYPAHTFGKNTKFNLIGNEGTVFIEHKESAW